MDDIRLDSDEVLIYLKKKKKELESMIQDKSLCKRHGEAIILQLVTFEGLINERTLDILRTDAQKLLEEVRQLLEINKQEILALTEH
jgi:hypothetical protein